MVGRKWIAGATLCLVLATTPSPAQASDLAFCPLDGLSGALLAAALGEDTVYAPTYTNEGFRRVRIGMSHRQVHELLGAPLATWSFERAGEPEGLAEQWSTSPSGGDFRMRVVHFQSGRVVRKVAEFWVD